MTDEFNLGDRVKILRCDWDESIVGKIGTISDKKYSFGTDIVYYHVDFGLEYQMGLPGFCLKNITHKRSSTLDSNDH